MRRPVAWRVALWGACALLALNAVAEDPNPPSIHSTRGAWPLMRQWTVAETHHLSAWIEHIYDMKIEGTPEQQRAKLTGVLTDPEMNLLLDPEFAGECNPQLDRGSIRAMHSVVDCAKLTVALMSYYSYRRGLPWMISVVRANDGSDIRTAEFTYPVGTVSCMDYPSPYAFITEALTCLCTGNYRVEPDHDRAPLSDTVPVAINRTYLRPGCPYYLDGHVLILGKIDPYGEIYFLDATTAASRDLYVHNGFNAVTGVTAKPRMDEGRRPYAGCYRGFRVYRYPIAEVKEDGRVVKVRRRTDEEMKEFGYSTEQYEKLAALRDRHCITEDGVSLASFHEFVRYRLRTVKQIRLTRVLEEWADDLAAMLERREALVQGAWHDVQENGPITFPEERTMETVFNASGRWGEWSSAAFDTLLRMKYFHALNWVDAAAETFERHPEYVSLDSWNENAIWCAGDLANVVAREKQRVLATRTFVYANSKGEPVTLTLDQLEERLYDLSFDPNHPPELRWGARPGSEEAQHAPEMPTPLPRGNAVPMAEAYAREAFYRTLTRWETGHSYLREMFTEGFPVQDKFDAHLASRWMNQPSPVLVPHGGRAAYNRELAGSETSGRKARRPAKKRKRAQTAAR